MEEEGNAQKDEKLMMMMTLGMLHVLNKQRRWDGMGEREKECGGTKVANEKQEVKRKVEVRIEIKCFDDCVWLTPM